MGLVWLYCFEIGTKKDYIIDMQVPVGLLIAVSFVCFLVITAFVISVLLIRDLLNKQKIYSNFAGYLSDFLVIISKEGRLIDASPTFISDPLYDLILRQKSFKRVFSAAEFKRFSEYVRGLDAYPDIPFVFAGSGPLEKELGGVPNVTVRGFLRGKELKETIRGALFAVYPSEWYENCPMSILEALGAGTPVLASDLGGSAELISTDGKNGTGALFRGGDAEDLAEKIREPWDDRKRTEGMSSRCRGFVQGHFDTPAQYAEKILGIYRGETDK